MAPWSVIFASSLQFATALSFVIMALLAYRYGSAAQVAAEAEVMRQGHPAELLVRGRVNFRETGAELVLSLAIALVLIVLATLNLAGNETARAATWVFQSMLLVVGGSITAGQVFALRFVKSAFRKSGDKALAAVDLKSLMDAATSAFPTWFRLAVVVRFALVTTGSAAVVILLILPSADDYFG